MHDALILSIANVLFEENESVRSLQLDAFKELQKQLNTFQNKGYDERLIDEIAEQRVDYILQTRTKTEMQKVMHPNYNNTDAEYGIKAEEIIFWAEASLRYPLRQKDAERYFGLVEEFFNIKIPTRIAGE